MVDSSYRGSLRDSLSVAAKIVKRLTSMPKLDTESYSQLLITQNHSFNFNYHFVSRLGVILRHVLLVVDIFCNIMQSG